MKLILLILFVLLPNLVFADCSEDLIEMSKAYSLKIDTFSKSMPVGPIPYNEKDGEIFRTKLAEHRAAFAKMKEEHNAQYKLKKESCLSQSKHQK